MRPIFSLAIGVCLAMTVAAAAEAQATATATPLLPPARPITLLPGTRVDVFATIKGSAIDAGNTALPSSLVRLRDARFGRVVDIQVTDKSGVFTFSRVDPGFYLVELFDNSQRTLAASPLVGTGAGTTASTSVKLPVSSSLLAGLFLLGSQGPVAGLVPVITSLPQAVLQTIPAIVPTGDPVSER